MNNISFCKYPIGVLFTLIVGATLTGCGLSPLVPDISPTVALEAVSLESVALPDDLVTTQPSGLRFVPIKKGDGLSPTAEQFVQVHYTGKLVDGTVFDSSLERGPFTFQMGQDEVITGWEEGIAMMNEGGEALLVLPPEIAYGEFGAGEGLVPPDATLFFTIELLQVSDDPIAAGPAVPTPTEVNSADYIEMASGLKYYDIQVGQGAALGPGSILNVHYTGWLYISGIKFDSSFDRLTPLTFVLGKGQVIDGWEQGVNTMRVGGKRQLIIPSELAYDNFGFGTMIPPDATLLFEIELVSIVGKPPRRPTVVDVNKYIETDTGLRYYDIRVGEGESPDSGDIVDVHYTGWLLTGTKFDNTYDRGNAFSFALGQDQVIPGWEQGIRTMKVGGKRQLIIPAELAYGEVGYDDLIPPGSTLIFEIELVYVQK